MKRIGLGLLAGLLMACQAPLTLTQTPAALRTQHADTGIASYYPIVAGRSWTFALEQTQNGQDNTKYKSMIMRIEPLAPEAGAERAVLRRGYPDATVTPTPSLIRRFSDRVELSRYQAGSSLERLTLNPPAGFTLPSVRGVNFVTALQLPLTVGNSWEGRIFQGGTETVSVKGEETLTVPAGRFQTLLIEHHLRYDNGKEDFLRYWYAPGVGMVKLYEELTAYFGQWLKFTSTGVLTQYGINTSLQKP